MAKTIVIDEKDNTRIPFLRGILTRSLQNAGVPFGDAYEVASQIRQELDDLAEIATTDLRERVSIHLQGTPHTDAVELYRSKSRAPATIIVEDSSGQQLPFSRARMQQRLESCGIPAERTMHIIRTIYDHLLKDGSMHVFADHLGRLTHQYIERDASPECAHQFLVWADFVRSGRPLLLLINGTAASGKSTISTEVASRLEIVRTQSTDMLRQVMRMLIPKRLVPVLHKSSFEAWQALPGQFGSEQTKSTQLLVTGFNRQAELLEVACEAVLNRAVQERVSVVLEGVHIRPSLVETVPDAADAIVVPVTIAVLKRDHLLRHAQGRGTKTPQRRAERYLANFDSIWRIQSYILSEADRAGIPIVVNEDKDAAVSEIIQIIGDVLAKDFSRTADEVFSKPSGKHPGHELSQPNSAQPDREARSWRNWWRRRSHR